MDGNTLSSNSLTITFDISPNITLNFPGNEFVANSTTINFNWTATDDLDISLICNLTIDGIVNVSNISATNGIPVDYTVSGFSKGIHYWNVTCWDSGGNIGNSNTYSFNVNAIPTHTTPILNSTYGTNLTNENLTCYNQSTSDQDGDYVKNIINWYRNGSSIMMLNMPFEGGSNDTFTKDYTEFGNNGTVINAFWNSTGGYDGLGAYNFDGTGDYIETSDDESLNPSRITISLWFKSEVAAGRVGLISKWGAHVYDGWFIEHYFNTNTIKFIFSY